MKTAREVVAHPWGRAVLAAGWILALSLIGARSALPERDFKPAQLPFKPKRDRVRVVLRQDFDRVIVREAKGANTVLLTTDNGQVRQWDLSGNALTPGRSGFRLEPAVGRFLEVEGRWYRGTLEAFINPLGVSVLVNETGLEEYLQGVVPVEMNPEQFPFKEAIKAQSVAARSFAVAELGRRARYGYDFFPDERSQVYGGTAREQTLSNTAVEETRGLYASYLGEPIVAFFSSTCGGMTASYEGAFQRPEIPYLSGGIPCPDQSSRYHQWKEEISVRKIQPLLDRYAGVGRLNRVELLKKDRTMRAVEMLFRGDGGEKILRGLQIRYALGLRSHFITSMESKRIENGSITQIVVSGKGFGHGVGMCQIGAVELARQGLEFSQILKRYYPGIEISRLAPGSNEHKPQGSR